MDNHKKTYKDYIKCVFCDKEYTRSNKTHHERSKFHNMHKRTILYIKNSLLNFKEQNGLEGISKRQYKTDDGDIIYLTKQQYELYNNAGNYNLKPL